MNQLESRFREAANLACSDLDAAQTSLVSVCAHYLLHTKILIFIPIYFPLLSLDFEKRPEELVGS